MRVLVLVFLGAAHPDRALAVEPTLRLTAEERDSLMDPVYTAVGRALWALTQALLPETAELPDERDEEPEPAVVGPHPTAAEEGGRGLDAGRSGAGFL